MNVKKQMGKRIRQARENLGLTQEQLSARIDKSQDAISSYEKGTRGIQIAELPRLAQALDVTVTYFFGDLEPDQEAQSLLSQLPPERYRFAMDYLRMEVEYSKRNNDENDDVNGTDTV
jgi:transcriptional regulator with XRE-family HTH domain